MMEEAMNGGYDWAEAFERGDYDYFGRGALLGRGGLYFLVFGVFEVWSFARTVIGGTRLLGVLGSGARNPHGILELGSRIGYS
jgi:hypothetical protein